VDDAQVLSGDPSVTYAYYQQNIKNQPAAPAPAGKTIWRCTVCGYTYEGDTLPQDFICPWCKHPASDFEKISG
jgi:rubrerythrin